MGFSLSNLFDPSGVFSGDKGDIINNSLDPVGGFFQQNPDLDFFGANDFHNDVGNWMDDLGDGNEAMAQNRWRNWRKGDGLQRSMMSGDLYASGSPWGTKLNNEVFHRDDKPIWNTLGGKTSEDYRYAESQGEDTSNNQGLDAVGDTIGKGFLNAFTFGLGSTATSALDNWGYDQSNDELLKNAAKNYVVQQVLPDTGSAIGNGILKGAAGSAINGGNKQEIGKGALTGGVTAGVKSGMGTGMDYLKNMFANEDDMPDVGTIGGTASEDNGGMLSGENSATLGGGITPHQAGADNQRQQAMGVGQQTSNPVQQFLQAFTSGGANGQGIQGNYGDMAAGLFGMYNANKQRKRMRQQSDSLASLFTPNSPYAQMARQKMERKDAAAGRRSQYGPRETQLAALLADRQAQTMPQQQKYADAIGGYDNMVVRNGLNIGQGLYKNRSNYDNDLSILMNLFKGGQ
jgi:hypothetical protein